MGSKEWQICSLQTKIIIWTHIFVVPSDHIGKPYGLSIQRKKDKYTSPEIQNEILSIISDQIIRSLAAEIRHSHFFALLADETTDASNRQQLVVCIRWIDDGLQAHEDFIGLYKIDNTIGFFLPVQNRLKM